jgi:hypothetical protein
MSRRHAWIRRALPALGLLLCGSGAAGCGGREADRGGPQTQLRPEDVVVASVDGVPISAARVAAHGRATGLSARESLDDLVDFELLAQAAARRGLAASPEVAEARTRELARRLLRADFEARTRPEDIPEADVRREYERNRRHFNHPELRSVMTVLFLAKKGTASGAEEQRSRAHAQELAERWRAEKPADARAARAIAETYYGHVNGFRVDQFITHKDAQMERDWLKVVMALKAPGAFAGPVRTFYGWQVVYLAELHPARHTPEAEALAAIRREMYPLWQRAAFARFLEETTGRHQVESHPERLRAAAGAAAPPPSTPAPAP